MAKAEGLQVMLNGQPASLQVALKVANPNVINLLYLLKTSQALDANPGHPYMIIHPNVPIQVQAKLAAAGVCESDESSVFAPAMAADRGAGQ